MVDLSAEMAELWGSLGAPAAGRARAVQFIAARRGEGTSSVAREFARFAARKAGRSVWLIDLDLFGSPQHAASPDGDDSAPSAPSPTTACSTLKTMLAGGDTPALTAFQTHTLYLLSPVVLALNATETQPRAALGRQAHSREWTFTPAVCLGPAFRSHAPPLV